MFVTFLQQLKLNCKRKRDFHASDGKSGIFDSHCTPFGEQILNYPYSIIKSNSYFMILRVISISSPPKQVIPAYLPSRSLAKAGRESNFLKRLNHPADSGLAGMI